MENIATKPMAEIFKRYPFAEDWLAESGFAGDIVRSFDENLRAQTKLFFQNNGCDGEEFTRRFQHYLDGMTAFLGENREDVREISILPGFDKNGNREQFDRVTVSRGNVAAVVGATGSGKSRLLADIEWGAAGDTPTGRTILLDGRRQTGARGIKNRIIAQLSQNMNFVIDLKVSDFLKMRAECHRDIQCHAGNDPDDLAEQVFVTANSLAGEPFPKDIPVTGLSGGQSRALMIADCAILSAAPVVLIDEIENAGINRREALSLLTGKDKIVFIATHDPVLALLADFRLIIKNGSITGILAKDETETAILKEVETLDRRLRELRDQLRSGERLTRP
jgi:ABC-type lipoprotein export system ATPase subunit